MPYPQFITPLDSSNLLTRRCSVPREEASQRILIIKFGALGDVLMATPLLSALREAHPEAHLSWMVEHTNRGAIDANPFVDEVIAWDGGYWSDLMPRRWKKWINPRRGFGFRWLASAFRFRRELRQRRYDVLISFHPEQWPLLVQGTGCHTAIGVFETEPRFGGKQRDYSHLYTTAYTAQELPLHRTNKYLTPLRTLNISAPSHPKMVLGFTPDDRRQVLDFLRQHDVHEDEAVIVLAPATTWESKRWPSSRYAQLGDALAEQLDCKIVLVGSPQENKIIARVAGEMTCRPVLAVGNLDFRQLAALLAHAKLVVSGDTGPMHAAAAVGTPYVALFGATTPARYAPLVGRGMVLAHAVPCGPCEWITCSQKGEDNMRCLRLISVDEVLGAASRLLTGELVA